MRNDWQAIREVRRWCRSGHARFLREEADLPLRAIAEQLGVAVRTVSRWELAERLPRDGHARAYYELLRELERGHTGERAHA